MKKRSRNVLITGVSSGIGFGLAKELVKRNYRVFGSVRNQADADRVLSELGASYIPLLFDVTRAEEIDKARDEVELLIGNEGLACLVNNSGIAFGGPLQHQLMDDIRLQFEVNVFGLISVTRAFLPLLGAVRDAPYLPGRIINISSVGGRFAAPFVGAYSATKHAVEGISGSWRRELLLYGIDVIVVGPGAVKTPIWKKGIDPEPYRDTDYGPYLGRFRKAAIKGAKKGLSTDYLGREIADIIERETQRRDMPLYPSG